MNWLLFAMLILLSACAPKEYFRTEIGATPCLIGAGKDCSAANLVVNPQDDYTLGFVEFDDHGRFYDQRQADALLNCLQDSQQPQYVVLYTHGWHHNAKDSDNNVRRFKESLRDIKLRNPQYRVIGVYLGWRGETVDTPWLRALTFWGRRAVSEQLGQKQFLDFLLNVEAIVKHDANPDNRLLTIGHSLGASVMLNALQPVEQVDMQGASQWDLAATAVGHFRGFITHRLEATATASINQACTVDTASRVNASLTGPEGVMASTAVWRVADGLQMRPVAEVPMADPLWVVQTDKYVLPNHGFMAQKPFWCFIEAALSFAASHG